MMAFTRSRFSHLTSAFFFVCVTLSLSSCVVGGEVFFSNETAAKYSDCLNQSLQPESMSEEQLLCYADVQPKDACDRESYSYFRCKSLLKQYSECTDDENIRKRYIERCME